MWQKLTEKYFITVENKDNRSLTILSIAFSRCKLNELSSANQVEGV